MLDKSWNARFRTHDQIRSRGALGSLNDGIEVTTQGVRTRLIAWPGNGFQTESIHLLTLAPGDESDRYEYDMSDEAMVCLKGQGEVYLRGQWVQIEAGDIAYFPERVSRALRNPKGNDRDFVVVNQIRPPQFDLYEPAGYYDRAHGEMNFDAIEKAKQQAPLGNLSTIANCITTTTMPMYVRGTWRWTRSDAVERSSICTAARCSVASKCRWCSSSRRVMG